MMRERRIFVMAFVLALVMALSASSVAVARDRTPPTAPMLSVVGVSSTTVSLAWTPSTDDSPYVWYQVFKDGSPSVWANANTSAVVQGLTPATTYVFTVKARDNGINWSAPSNAVTVTTKPADPNDSTPPTTPANFTGFDGGCGEGWLSWTQSTDNVDAQAALRYEIRVNGVMRPESTVYGRGRTVAYAVAVGSNTFEVFAIDGAGNASAPASITLQMSPPC